MRSLLTLIIVASCCSSTSLVAAPPTEADLEVARKARLAFVQERFMTWKLMLKEDDQKVLAAQKEPLIRFSNPVLASVNDGMLFIWRDANRPLAACSYSIRGTTDVLDVYVEFSTMHHRALRIERDGRSIWQPKTAVLVDQPLPAKEAVPDRPVARLSAMRQLAARFRATEHEVATKQNSELRLMPQPVDRFKSPEYGVVDGALFAYATGNDPQLLLRLEIVENAAKELTWQYTLSRMASHELTVYFDDVQIMNVENFWRGPKSPQEAYREQADGTLEAGYGLPAGVESVRK
jgi:hypothetical protein